jgi:hypothetical protein
LVEHQSDVLILPDRLGEAIEEFLHRLGIHVRQDQSERVISSRLDGRKDIGKREALVAQARRALAALPPDVARPSFLSDARLVLKKQADTLAFMRMLNFSEKCWGSF